MWKFRSLFPAAAFLSFALLANGCGGKQPASLSPDDDSAPAPVATGKSVDPATSGSVTGVVKFDGVPRKAKVINMSAVPSCVKEHSSPVMSDDVVLGDNNTLENVVVYLKGDFRQYSFPVATSPVTLDQKGCLYGPTVAAVMTGQQLQVTNSDQLMHNVNAAPALNRKWNVSQSPGSAPMSQVFTHGEIGIPVKCNVHPWMKAYLAVFSNPYFQVTGQNGSFKITNVPPGKYTLVAWHEIYGVKEQPVTIDASQEQTASITFTDRDRR